MDWRTLLQERTQKLLMLTGANHWFKNLNSQRYNNNLKQIQINTNIQSRHQAIKETNRVAYKPNPYCKSKWNKPGSQFYRIKDQAARSAPAVACLRLVTSLEFWTRQKDHQHKHLARIGQLLATTAQMSRLLARALPSCRIPSQAPGNQFQETPWPRWTPKLPNLQTYQCRWMRIQQQLLQSPLKRRLLL